MMEDVVRLTRIVAHEGEGVRLGIHGEERRLSQRRGIRHADRCEGQVRRDIERRQRLAETYPRCEYGHPNGRKRVVAPALDRGPNRQLHPTPSFQLGRANDPSHTVPPRTATLQLRCTLDWRAAYWAACTSNTSGT